MGFWNAGFQALRRRTALLLAYVLLRHHHVDTVRFAGRVRVEPRELELELFGCKGDRAQYAEASCTCHSGHHVTAVTKSEDRELNAQLFGESSLHAASKGA